MSWTLTSTRKKLMEFFADDPPFAAITRSQLINFFAWLTKEYVSDPDGVAPRGKKQLSPKTIFNISESHRHVGSFDGRVHHAALNGDHEYNQGRRDLVGCREAVSQSLPTPDRDTHARRSDACAHADRHTVV